MAMKAFQSSFNPLTNYLWPDLTECHPDNVYKTLWTTNLPPNTSEQEVRSLFEPFGSIVIVELMKELKTQAFAQITYRYCLSGILALCDLNNRNFRGRNIHVSTYVYDAPSHRGLGVSHTIYLELPDDLSTRQLFFHLRAFGLIVNLRFVKESSRPSKQLARVAFLEEDGAQNAVRCLNGSELGEQRIFACPWRDRPYSRSSGSCSRSSTGWQAVQEPLPVNQIASHSIKFLPKPLLPCDNLPLPVDTSSLKRKLDQSRLTPFPPQRFSETSFLVSSLPEARFSSAFGIPPIARFSGNTASSPDGLAGININVASSVLRDINNIPWARPPVNLPTGGGDFRVRHFTSVSLSNA